MIIINAVTDKIAKFVRCCTVGFVSIELWKFPEQEAEPTTKMAAMMRK